MNTKIKIIMVLTCVIFGCIALSACGKNDVVDKYQQAGYLVSVNYNSNGGTYLNRDGVTLTDMFKPADYTADSNGKINIKLVDPLSDKRATSGISKITASKYGYFLAGWYRECTVRKDNSGNVISDDGEVLTEQDGKYYNAEGKNVSPAYDYDGLWNFDTDAVEYANDGKPLEITLYAGWVPNYRFDYYCKNEKGEWELYGSNNFNYITTNAEGSSLSDKDTIWMPDWKDGAMNYTYQYANNTNYEFPHPDNVTFSKAYTDAECKNEITVSFEHRGTLDIAKCKAINNVENIYVEFIDGVRYKISNASELSNNANLSGIYEITDDLDFNGIRWPMLFVNGIFTGVINGNGHTISNVTATCTNANGSMGGLFGNISGAIIKDITLKDVVVDISATGRNMNSDYGLFAGYIDESEKTSVTGIKIAGGTLKLGNINLQNGYRLNLVANGNVSGIEVEGRINLQIYGKYNTIRKSYSYSVNPDEVKVDEYNEIELTFTVNLMKDQEYYDIKYWEDEQ